VQKCPNGAMAWNDEAALAAAVAQYEPA
jgi:hypothetical protein